MSDGMTDFYRASDFATANDYLNLAREEYTIASTDENRKALKEAVDKVRLTVYGRRAFGRFIDRYGSIDGYCDYLLSINSMMAT